MNGFSRSRSLTEVVTTILIVFFLVGCADEPEPEPEAWMQWHRVSLAFDGPKTSENASPNPFLDYRMDVTFTGPSEQTYRVPGYYAADGNAAESGAGSGNKWRVLFSPDEAGEWRYEASFVSGPRVALNLSGGTPAGYFHGATGTFSVVPNDKDPAGRDFRAKGKLEYIGEHFLQFKGNKEYFLKAGANSPEVFLEYADFDNTPSDRTYALHVQDWEVDDPTWKSGKGKGLIGMVNYIAGLDNNVIYFMLMNAEGDGKKAWPWITADSIWRYDVSKLDQWDIVFSHMQAKGVMTHFVLSETENESYFEWKEERSTGGFADSRKLYYREMVARFGYHPAVTWNVGEENGWADFTGDEGVKKAVTTPQRKEFADYLRALVHYNDHIVVHNGPSEDYHIYDRPNDNILGHPSYTGPSMQGDFLAKMVYQDVLRIRNLSVDSGHRWVVTMDEPYITPQRGDEEIWRKENVWAAFMAGGAGIELYIGGGLDLRLEELRGYESYYKSMATALNFFKTYVPFWELEPDDAFLENAWTLKNEGEFYVFYFKEGGTASVDLPAGDYRVFWFDPRNGGDLHEGSVTSISGGSTTLLGVPPDNVELDWVCLVMR